MDGTLHGASAVRVLLRRWVRSGPIPLVFLHLPVERAASAERSFSFVNTPIPYVLVPPAPYAMPTRDGFPTEAEKFLPDIKDAGKLLVDDPWLLFRAHPSQTKRLMALFAPELLSSATESRAILVADFFARLMVRAVFFFFYFILFNDLFRRSSTEPTRSPRSTCSSSSFSSSATRWFLP